MQQTAQSKSHGLATDAGGACGMLNGAPSIVLDLEECTGCGNCYTFAPSTFIVTEDLKVALTGRYDAIDDMKQAAEACPVDAIALRSADGRPL